MPTRLYLDSARMGLLSERARLAHLDYVRLAATEGCSLYFSEFLHGGFQQWPARLRRRYPALSDWRGAHELQQTLRQLVGAPADWQVLLANRTAQLVKLAARRLCENTRRVLVSDTLWPSYRRSLEFERQAHCVGISTVPVRNEVYSGDTLSVDQLVQRFTLQYDRMGCDSLFLPAISHDGVRLPVDTICRHLNRVRPLRFVVVDAAQAIGHVPAELGMEHCDILLAGCHKWLKGHLPMGVAYLPKRQSAVRTCALAEQLMRKAELDDPLLTFLYQLETGQPQSFSETVNLASLFTCRAALGGNRSPEDIRRQLDVRIHNAGRVKRLVPYTGWVPLGASMPNGIVMLQAACQKVRQMSPDSIRSLFAAHSISITAYDEGLIRLSMPETPLTRGELDLLIWTLRHCGLEEKPIRVRASRVPTAHLPVGEHGAVAFS